MTAMLPKKAPPADESVVLSDETLVERLRGGEPQAGDELARRYAPALLRYLARLCSSALAAEDLHQQVWLSVLDHIDRFDVASGPGGFRAWLFRIATNKANDLWRSKARQRSATEALLLIAENQGLAPDSSHRLLATEETQKLQTAIAELPAAQREVVCMRYYGNLEFVEIAQALGCPLNTALGRMHKALLRLRKLMDDEAVGGES
jgi:RNA polymerase sigma-70 factor (ECF subfamily)